MVPYGPGAPRLCTRGHRSVSTCLMEYQRGDGGYQGLQAAEGLRWHSPSSGWINETFLCPVSRGPCPGVAEEDLRSLGCRGRAHSTCASKCTPYPGRMGHLS